MTKRLNIALVTDVMPDDRYTAGQVLEKITRNTPQASFDVYWINQSNLKEPIFLPGNVRKVKTFAFGRVIAILRRIRHICTDYPAHIALHSIKWMISELRARWRVGLSRAHLHSFHSIKWVISELRARWRAFRPKLRPLKKIYGKPRGPLLDGLVLAVRCLRRGFLSLVLFPVYVAKGLARALRLKSLCDRSVNWLSAFISFLGLFPQGIIIGFRLRSMLGKADYDAIWLVLQGEKLALAYTILSYGAKRPIILQQWDPISWWSQNHRHGGWVARGAEIMVRGLEEKAYANLVPSYQWQAAQTARNLRSLRIDNFFTSNGVKVKPSDKAAAGGPLNAVFIGQIYACDELRQIAASLNKEAARLGKKVIINYFGRDYLDLGSEVTQVNHAFLDPEALVDRLQQFDVALLPYPLAPNFIQTSTLSFPSKSKIYLAAGLPILALCRLDSSPHIFYKEHYGDYYFNLAEGGNFSSYIEKISDRSEAEVGTRTALASKVLAEHFSAEVELKPFHEILENLARA